MAANAIMVKVDMSSTFNLVSRLAALEAYTGHGLSEHHLAPPPPPPLPMTSDLSEEEIQ